MRPVTWLRDFWWAGWSGCAVLLVLLLFRSAPPPPAAVFSTVTASGTATARGGRQVVRIPVLGATVYIEVLQECPELVLTTTTTAQVVAICPPPPRVALGVTGAYPLLFGADLSLRLGRVWVGPAVYWLVGSPVAWGARIAYAF